MPETENAPQLPPPEGEPQQQEAMQIPVQDAETPLADTEDTRWNEDKARTVGMATREAGYSRGEHDPFDDTKSLEWARGRLSMMDSDEQITWGGDVQDKAQKLEKQKQVVENYKARGEEVPEDQQHWLEHDQVEYDQAKTRERERLGEDLEDETGEREEAIAKLERPFEELYDLAPDTFANMPTSEFMEVTREFTSLEKKLKLENRSLWTAEQISTVLKEHLEKKQGLHWDSHLRRNSFYSGNVAVMVDEIQDALRIGGVTSEEYERIAQEVEDKYKAVFAGSFDKTPKQIVESALELTDGYAQQIAGKVQEALRQKQEFLKKHGIKTEPETPEVDATVVAPESVN